MWDKGECDAWGEGVMRYPRHKRSSFPFYLRYILPSHWPKRMSCITPAMPSGMYRDEAEAVRDSVLSLDDMGVARPAANRLQRTIDKVQRSFMKLDIDWTTGRGSRTEWRNRLDSWRIKTYNKGHWRNSLNVEKGMGVVKWDFIFGWGGSCTQKCLYVTFTWKVIFIE